MRTRRLPEPPATEKFNMTPMIDIVFQLIIFFMLVMDMSSRRNEDLVLPSASTAGNHPDPREIHVNVTAEGKVRISGRTFTDGALDALLRERAPGTAVLIRADRSTDFEHVQKILMMAADPEHAAPVRFAARKE